MRTLLLLSICILFQGTAIAQKVMRLDSARTKGLGTAHMDSLYVSGLDAQDSTKAAFTGPAEEFVEQFHQTLQAIGAHLSKAGFRWGEDTRVLYRMFFAADGSVEHFHYQVRQSISPEHEQELQRALEDFMGQYRFPLKASVPYKQCGTALFKDK